MKRPKYLWFRVRKVRKSKEGYYVYCAYEPKKTSKGKESHLVLYVKAGGRPPMINSQIKVSFEYFDYGDDIYEEESSR